MTEDDWNFPDSRFISYVLAAPEPDGAPLFVIINGADEDLDITFPEWPGPPHWQNVLDTAMGEPQTILGDTGSPWTVRKRSILAFAGAP
jgi:glycogen operon protein